MKFKSFEHPSDYLDQLKLNDKLAVAASYELSRSKTKHIYCFDNENIIYEYSLKMLVRKDFSLLRDLNNFLRGASEGGLIEKWLENYRSLGAKKDHIEFTGFKLESIYFLLCVCVAFLILAFLAIIVERTTFRNNEIPNAKPFWRYVEMIISPYRYFYQRNANWNKHRLTEFFFNPRGK